MHSDGNVSNTTTSGYMVETISGQQSSLILALYVIMGFPMSGNLKLMSSKTISS